MYFDLVESIRVSDILIVKISISSLIIRVCNPLNFKFYNKICNERLYKATIYVKEIKHSIAAFCCYLLTITDNFN